MIRGADQKMMAQVRLGRAHGMTTSTVQRLNGLGTYDVTMLGFNHRMTQRNAALALDQLGKLSGWNARRKALTLQYKELLTGSGIGVPFATQRLSTHHIFPVLD